MNQEVLNYDTVVTASANVKDTVRIEPQDSKKIIIRGTDSTEFLSPVCQLKKWHNKFPKGPFLPYNKNIRSSGVRTIKSSTQPLP